MENDVFHVRVFCDLEGIRGFITSIDITLCVSVKPFVELSFHFKIESMENYRPLLKKMNYEFRRAR